MLRWSLENPGLHRFISSDPLDPERIQPDIMETVIEMKGWLEAVLALLGGATPGSPEARRLVDITLGYLDGEIFNLINGRVLPGEDIAGRVLDNLDLLFSLLGADGEDIPPGRPSVPPPEVPR